MIKKFSLTALIFLSIAFLLFYKLGSTFLTNWDEAWYADISRNMLHTGNLLTPAWDHHPFFDKPPFYFWLETLSFRIFGVTEFAARFFSALSALGVCVVTYLLSKKLSGKRAALISLVVIGSTIGFLYRSRTGNIDATLTLWVLLSIYFFYLGLEKSQYFFWMGVSVAFGFLTKGMVAFIFPVLGIIWMFLCHPERSEGSPTNVISRILNEQSSFRLRSNKLRDSSAAPQNDKKLGFRMAWGVLIAIGVPAAWFLLNLSANGLAFLTGFSHNQIGKISNSSNLFKSFSLDYISYLKSGQKIWFLFFVPAFVWSLIKWWDRKIVNLGFFLIYFLILSISENKSNWFLMPLYPLATLMIGDFLIKVKWLEKKWVGMGILWGVVLLGLIQVYHFRSEFIVPETETDEVKVALAAKQMTNPNDVLYLTGLSYPTIIYYSERESYVTFGGQYDPNTFWVLPGSSWQGILKKDPVYIITTDQEMKSIEQFRGYTFKTLYQSGDRKLVKKS